MALPAGIHLGPYEILQPIGAGGMGQVYKARDTRLNRTVAIKVLPPEFASRPDWTRRFEREAQTIASLNHPHIWNYASYCTSCNIVSTFFNRARRLLSFTPFDFG
jgi:serine/threonine protein kinase